jgi:hypothetical protein
MKKKFFTGLAPLLVIAACAMAPASALGSAEITWPSCVAPACPHLYKNGILQKAKTILPGIAWGTLTLNNEKLGEVTCKNIFAGFGENPSGNVRTVGKVQAFFPYECAAPTCASGGGVLSVTAANSKGELSMPWTGEAVEQPAGTFYGKAGFKGPSENKKATKGTGQIEFNINCTTIVSTDFFGVNYVHTLNNGISIGSAPGESEGLHEITDPAHFRNLESTENAGGKGEVTKAAGEANLKGEGYQEEELLEIKNP